MTTPVLSHDREEQVSKPRPAIETLKPEPNRVVEAMEAAAREVASRMAAAADQVRDQAIEHVRHLGRRRGARRTWPG